MFGKLMLAIVVAAAVGIGLFVFSKKDNLSVTQSQQQNDFLELESGKRGDDPLYSEEIKKNTALTLQARDKAEDLARQLETLRREKADSDKRAKNALKKIETLAERLEALAKKEDDTHINATLKKEVDAKVNELSQTITELNKSLQENAQRNNEKFNSLETALTATVPPVDGMLFEQPENVPAENLQPPPEVKKTSAITYAYGKTPSSEPSSGGDNVVDKGINSINDFLSNGFGGKSSTDNNTAVTNTERQNPPNQAQKVLIPTKKEEWPTVFPVYTLPTNTVLAGSTLITPIIGRVPLSMRNGSNVADPFFFKVEIGSENLAANGHKIPGVAKMIASGYATGVREQSCARGYIDSITFIFIDGRIVTQGETAGTGTSNGQALGYLADQWGKPCIRGTYINNAKDYLMSRGLAAFAEGAAAGLSASQVSTTQSDSGNYQAILDGNVWSYILGQGIGSSASELADYIRERTANAFDVVYVEQAKKVQIWLNQTLPIDYDATARKIQYYAEPNNISTYD